MVIRKIIKPNTIIYATVAVAATRPTNGISIVRIDPIIGAIGIPMGAGLAKEGHSGQGCQRSASSLQLEDPHIL